MHQRTRLCFATLILSAIIAAPQLSFAESSGDVEAGQWRADPNSSRHFREFVSLLKHSPQEQTFQRQNAEHLALLWDPTNVRLSPDRVERRGSPHTTVKSALEAIFGQDFALPSKLQMPLDIDVRARPPVVGFVGFWTTRARSTMGYYLARMGRYETLIRTIFREEGVPEDMIYLCLIESGFSPRAHSPANAGGMWQFIPATAVNYGLRIDGEVDERRDPIKSTRASARLLRNLYEKLGSWPLAMAGYNAGSGHVVRAMRKANSDSYWVLARRDTLYENTRDYVAKILAAALIGNNREAFGFEAVVSQPALTFDTVQVPGGTTLTSVAEALGVGVDQLRSLNPELLAARTPGRAKMYMLNIPKGKAATFVRVFDGQDGNVRQGYTTTLRIGESVAMAARTLNVPEQVLRSMSGLPSKGRIAYGTSLVVPQALLQKRAPHLVPSSGSNVLQRPQHSIPSGKKIPVLLPNTQFDYPNHTRVFYRTRGGDTLAELSQFFKAHPSVVAMWNDLETHNALKGELMLQFYVPQDVDLSGAVVLRENQVRCIYDGTEAYLHEAARQRHRPAGSGSGGGRSYNVRPGETLESIATKFGITRDELARWNNLKGRSLKPGYRLVIYSGRSRPTPPKPDQVAKYNAPENRTARKKKSTRKKRAAPPRRPVRRSGTVRHQLH